MIQVWVCLDLEQELNLRRFAVRKDGEQRVFLAVVPESRPRFAAVRLSFKAKREAGASREAKSRN